MKSNVPKKPLRDFRNLQKWIGNSAEIKKGRVKIADTSNEYVVVKKKGE